MFWDDVDICLLQWVIVITNVSMLPVFSWVGKGGGGH